MDKVLVDYKTKVKRATLLIIQSEIPPIRLSMLGLRASNEFPVVKQHPD